MSSTPHDPTAGQPPSDPAPTPQPDLTPWQDPPPSSDIPASADVPPTAAVPPTVLPPADAPPATPPPPASTAYPQPPQAAAPPPAYGTPAGAPLSVNDEKTWALATHLLCLVGGFVAPLIVWLVFKGRGPFLEHHAKEALNFQLTVMIAAFVAVITAVILVGFVLLLVLAPWMIIMPIIAAVKASNGEWYRYPLTIRFVS